MSAGFAFSAEEQRIFWDPNRRNPGEHQDLQCSRESLGKTRANSRKERLPAARWPNMISLKQKLLGPASKEVSNDCRGQQINSLELLAGFKGGCLDVRRQPERRLVGSPGITRSTPGIPPTLGERVGGPPIPFIQSSPKGEWNSRGHLPIKFMKFSIPSFL